MSAAEQIKDVDTTNPESKPKTPIFRDVADDDEKAAEKAKLEFRKTFYFECENPDDPSKPFAGNFTCHRLNIGEQGQVGVEKARLNAGLVVDRGTDWLHEAMAYLTYALSDAPEWWNPAAMFDPTPLREMFLYVKAWERSFRK